MSSRKRKQPTPTSESDTVSCQQRQASSSSNERSSNGNAKYNRIHYACSECYRRKQKCNRKRPCQHCLARNLAHRCKDYLPFNNNNSNQDSDSDSLSVSRLTRVEQLLEDCLPRILHRVESTSSTNPLPLIDTFRDQLGGSSLATAAIDHTETERLEPQGRLSPETGLYNGGPTSHITSLLDGLPGGPPPEIHTTNLPIRTTRPTCNFDQAMIKHGRPSPASSELLAALISRDHCKVLVKHYFDRIDWMHQPFPHRRMRQSLDDFLQCELQSATTTLTIQNINVFAVLCGVCAVATLSVHHVLFPDLQAQRGQIARRYHYAARRALLMSSFMGREDLDLILALVLSCHFLTLDRHYNEAFAAAASVVRAAFAIGLHRDGTKLGLSQEEVETRRRSWAAVYCLDRSMAAATARPALIDERFCDTQDLDDQATWHLALQSPPSVMAPAHAGPAPPPTTYTLTFYRYRLARLEGQVADLFQRLDGPVSIESVLALDRKIVEFQTALPFYFQAELDAHVDGIRIDKSLDKAYPFLLTHRYLIQSCIDNLRMALHRPYFVRFHDDAASRVKLAACRTGCLQAALHQAELLRDSVDDLRTHVACPASRLVWRVQIGTQFWFQALLICGLGLLMDPHARIAARLRSHLEYYLHEYHDQRSIATDEMCEREAKVIGLFLSRLEKLDLDPHRRAAATGGDQPPANRHPNPSDASLDEMPPPPPELDPRLLAPASTSISFQHPQLSSDALPVPIRDSTAPRVRSSRQDEDEAAAAYGRAGTSSQSPPPVHGAAAGAETAPLPLPLPLATSCLFAPLGLSRASMAPLDSSLANASAPVSAGATALENPEFDPAYWQDLIDKILS